MGGEDPRGGEGGAAPGAAGAFAGCSLPHDHLLTDQGWEWRGNADERRGREMTETYQELGFEVRLEPLNLEQLSEDCQGCKDALDSFSAVYVRRKT